MKVSNTFYVSIGLVVLFSAAAYVYNNSQEAASPDNAPNRSSAVTDTPAFHELASKDGSLDVAMTAEHGVQQRLTALNEEIVMLKTEMLAVKSAVQTLSQAGNTTAPALTPAEERQQTADLRAQDAENLKQRNNQLETDFRKQRTDPSWSSQTRNLIRTALEEENIAGADIIGIECRSTMCRVELAVTNSEQMSKAAMVSAKVGPELPNVMVNQGHDGAVFYFSKAVQGS